MFTLPAIEAGQVGVTFADGVPVMPGTKIVPYLRVLPMGWSWALHICQQVLNHALDCAGFEQSRIIGDKRASVKITGGEDIAAAGYVDNFGVFGTSPAAVNQGLSRIATTLRGFGLTVHEEEEAQMSADFVGLHCDGKSGYVSIKPGRILKIRSAVDELLRRQFCSGKLLQLLLGHCTWALMGRREGLSILRSSYAFMHQNLNRSSRLWPSVRQELVWVRDLLPLFRMQINCGWATDITASDSSPWGFGVCHRTIPEQQVREYGACSERWRFKCEDAIRARENTFRGQNPEDVLASSRSPKKRDPQDLPSFIKERGFDEIPPELLDKKAWETVWLRPWVQKQERLCGQSNIFCAPIGVSGRDCYVCLTTCLLCSVPQRVGPSLICWSSH